MSTATETVATVDRIAGDLAEVVRQRAELEALRSAIVLDGGDLDAFSDRLSRLDRSLRAVSKSIDKRHRRASTTSRHFLCGPGSPETPASGGKHQQRRGWATKCFGGINPLLTPAIAI